MFFFLYLIYYILTFAYDFIRADFEIIAYVKAMTLQQQNLSSTYCVKE